MLLKKVNINTKQTEIELIMDVLELSSSSDELDLTINTSYASKYDQWRSKEEYQKRVLSLL